MSKPLVFTEEQKKEIIKSYKDGLNTREIANLYNCSTSYIYRFLNYNNFFFFLRELNINS